MNMRCLCSIRIRCGFYRTKFIFAVCASQQPAAKMSVSNFAASAVKAVAVGVIKVKTPPPKGVGFKVTD